MSLLRLELAANERQIAVLNGDDVETLPLSLNGEPELSEKDDNVVQGDDLPFTQIKPILADALARNHILREATRHSAKQLLLPARILLHAKAPLISVTEVRSQVESGFLQPTGIASLESGGVKPKANYEYRSEKGTAPPGCTPLLRLPPELIAHILRCYTALEAIPLPPNPSTARSFNPGQATPPVFASALSESQFRRILALAQDRSTLSGMTHHFSAKTGGLKRDSRDPGKVSLHDATSFLSIVKCQDYERRNA